MKHTTFSFKIGGNNVRGVRKRSIYNKREDGAFIWHLRVKKNKLALHVSPVLITILICCQGEDIVLWDYFLVLDIFTYSHG